MHLDIDLCNKGYYFSKYWEALPKLIRDSGGKSNWLHHFLLSKIVANVKTGNNLLETFNNNSSSQDCHSYIETFLSHRIVFRALKTWIRLILVAWKLKNVCTLFTPQGSVSSLWPFLKRDWMTSIIGTSSIHNCLWISLFDVALKDIPYQDKGLYLCENQGWERAFLHAWRKHGHGKIIGVPHATVPFWHLYYFDDPRTISSSGDFSQPLPDQLAVNGPMAWDYFLESCYRPEQLAKVEALRFLIPEVSAKKSETDYPKSKNNHLCDPVKITILVVGDYSPLFNHQLLSDLEKTMEILPNHYSLTFKPHPGLDVDMDNYTNLMIQKTSEALENILSSFDLVIATNSTSASVDAFLAGLPIIVRVDGSSLNLSPLRGQDGVCFVSNVNDFVKAISNISTSKTNNRKQDYFWIDSHLPRWKTLLNLEENSN